MRSKPTVVHLVRAAAIAIMGVAAAWGSLSTVTQVPAAVTARGDFDAPLDDPALGLEEFGTPAERALPETVDLRILTTAANATAGRQALPASKTATRAIDRFLGAGWKSEQRGGPSGPLVLTGPGGEPAGASSGAASAAALGLMAVLAGMLRVEGETPAEFEVLYDRARGPSRTVRLRRRFEGARVQGAEVATHFDASGRLRSVTAVGTGPLVPENARTIEADAAVAIARSDLEDAEPGIAILGAASTEPWLWLDGARWRHVWLVRHATRRPLGSFVTRIDAESGAVLDRSNLIESYARNGKGRVFRTNADYPNRTILGKLTGLEAGSLNSTGFLQGGRFSVFDAKGAPAASAKLSYLFHPFDFNEQDAFDQVSAYYHLERAHARWAMKLGVEGAPWFDGPSVPAIVNAGESYGAACNAFYSRDLYGAGSPGFVFGDQDTCPFPNVDLARDSDIIYHEYTHAVLDWRGLGLGMAPPSSYLRSISEAVADYHAANATGDPEIGEVFGVTRNLSNHKVYPLDVGCADGFMEEHCTGEIWGGFLWDVQRLLKGRAETLELASLDYMIDNWPSGHLPGQIDFWDAAVGMLEASRTLVGGAKESLIYGAAVSRGILGIWPHPGDSTTIVYQNFDHPGRFTSVGWIHAGGWHSTFFFAAPSGSVASIRVRSTSRLNPTFGLWEGTSGSNLFAFEDASDVRSGEASIQTTLPPTSGVYAVDVHGVDDVTEGSFQILVTIK